MADQHSMSTAFDLSTAWKSVAFLSKGHMSTIMMALAILLIPAALGFWAQHAAGHSGAGRLGGTIGLSLAFAFFGLGHFLITDALVEMLPPFVPARTAIILATGLLELAIAVGLLVPAWRRIAGLAAAGVLVAFFPANIYAALNAVGPAGHAAGPIYLLIRVPLQIFLLGWTYWFVLRPHPGRS
jgi:uncharacterized membrane protein